MRMASRHARRDRITAGECVKMTDQNLVTTISDTLDDAGIHVAVTRTADGITLAGQVDSDENRRAALDVAKAVAAPAGIGVNDQLEVTMESPELAFADASQPTAEYQYADPAANPEAVLDPELELDPDFTDDIGTTDGQLAAEEGVTFFPPTDPVVRPITGDQEIAVVGGFGATSMDDDATGPTDAARNDDDIADDVRRELLEDALTTDLGVEVAVRDGLVVLMGSVPSIDDVENAEAVASRVPGIVEIREQLRIEPVGGK